MCCLLCVCGGLMGEIYKSIAPGFSQSKHIFRIELITIFIESERSWCEWHIEYFLSIEIILFPNKQLTGRFTYCDLVKLVALSTIYLAFYRWFDTSFNRALIFVHFTLLTCKLGVIYRLIFSMLSKILNKLYIYTHTYHTKISFVLSRYAHNPSIIVICINLLINKQCLECRLTHSIAYHQSI